MTKPRAVALMTLAYILWGLLPMFWKLLQAVPADRIIAHRIVWSFLFLLLLLAATRRLSRVRESLADPRRVRLLVLAALFITVNWLTYVYAVNTGYIVETSLGYYINPLVSIALGAIFYRERFSPLQFVAIGLAAAGVAILTIQAGSLPWISLVLAFSFGVYGLIKKRAGADPVAGLAIETAVLSPFALVFLLAAPAAGLLGASLAAPGDGASATSAAAAAASAASSAAAASPAAWFPPAGSPWLLALLPLSGVLTATPLLLFAGGTNHLDLSLVGFLQYIAPTLGLLLGVFAYGERFTPAHAACFGLIWSGLVLYSLSKVGLLNGAGKRAKPKNPPPPCLESDNP